MIKTKSFFVLIIQLLLVFAFYDQANAQSGKEAEVKSLVSFYRYMLNTIGDSQTSARDKETIIKESYKKAFLNNRVQIEDDLLPDRRVITNKDVNAYLRDVDFFFRDIKFSFDDIKIEASTTEAGEEFYLVTFQKTIDATTIEGEPYKSNKKRFMDVNIDAASGDLKIASVYSTRVSREKELALWWDNLSFGWKEIFKSHMSFDSASTEVLLRLAAIDSISLAGNPLVQSLDPLLALTQLRVLDIRDTKVDDISPLRYSMRLKKLDAANTSIRDIDMIAYFNGLQYLDVSNTYVTDIAALSGVAGTLEYLSLSGISVFEFDALKSLKQLRYLDISNTGFSQIGLLRGMDRLQALNLGRTGVSNVQQLDSLKSLRVLDVSESYVGSLDGLQKHPSLREITLNQTNVSSLDPLMGVPNLSKVYADYTGVSEASAFSFMSKVPKVVVVTNSEKLMDWWQTLTNNWKNALTPYLEGAPSKESIIALLNTDSLNVAGKQLLNDEPLKRFRRVRYLDISQNRFQNFNFATSMESLEALLAKKSTAKDLSGLQSSKSLKYLDLEESAVIDIQALHTLNKLELLNLEGTGVSEYDIKLYLLVNPKTVVVYQTDKLIEWWEGLSEAWQEAFKLEKVGAIELHRLIEREKVRVDNKRISSLEPLRWFINLERVYLDRTQVSSLAELSVHERLEEISCTNGPLANLDGLEVHADLIMLDVSNTAVEKLKPIRSVTSLKVLNCSGTNIKTVKHLSNLRNLENLNISNTRVWKLNRLYDLRNPKLLTCYNTRLRDSEVEAFKDEFPDCTVTYY